MTEIQRADRAARRRAGWLVAVGALVGLLAILGAEHLQGPLRDWLLARPDLFARRIGWLAFVLGALAVLPLLAAAALIWRIAGRAVRAQRFPPPGQGVVRDTTVLHGPPAVARGRLLRILALAVCVAAAAMAFAFWRLASIAGPAGD